MKKSPIKTINLDAKAYDANAKQADGRPLKVLHKPTSLVVDPGNKDGTRWRIVGEEDNKILVKKTSSKASRRKKEVLLDNGYNASAIDRGTIFTSLQSKI